MGTVFTCTHLHIRHLVQNKILKYVVDKQKSERESVGGGEDAHACAHVRMCPYLAKCAIMEAKSRHWVSRYLLFPPSYSLEQGLLLNLELTGSTKLAEVGTPGPACLPQLSNVVVVTHACQHSWF